MSEPTPPKRKFPLQLDGLSRPGKISVTQPSAKPGVSAQRGAAPTAELRAGLTAALPRAVLRPQQPLQQAVLDSARLTRPSGVGLDSEGVRRRMVQRLAVGGLRDEAVAAALAQVPRHLFVDTALVNQAYEDTSLPIGLGQTISKPSVVARMIELLMAGVWASSHRSLGQTLEIGTGCGYQAAVLACLAKHVISIERLRPLHEKARDLLAPVRASNIRLVYGDGMRGHPPNAPYHSIISAAGGESLPEAWLDQLAPGGRLVAPVHDASGVRQVLIVVDRTQDGFTRSLHEAVNFVPLKSGTN